LTVVVTHVKDTFRNGEDVPTKVLKDLETLERQKQLGVFLGVFCLFLRSDAVFFAPLGFLGKPKECMIFSYGLIK